MTRALVTGGAGFIGHHLCNRLLDDGTDVVVLDNLSSPSPLALPDQVAFVEGDVVDPPAIEGRFDYIYHFASLASPPRYLADPVGTLRASAEGTREMLDLASKDGSVFVYASTSEIYGDPLVHPQTEEYFGNVDITSPRACYDEAKRYGEALTHAYHRTGAVRDTRVARIFNTYGPAMAPDDGRIVTNFLSQALAASPLTIYGDGSQTRSFCFVEDLVDGILLLAHSNSVEPINLGNDVEITVSELADHVAEVFGDSGREYRELPQSDPVRRRPDLTRAREMLGWEPSTSLDHGLRVTAEYLASLETEMSNDRLPADETAFQG